MDKYLEQIIQISDLEIMEYDLETRRELSNRNRIFPFYVMSYLQKGEAVLEVNGKRYETGPGSIVIIPEHVRHSHYKTDRKPTTFLWWHFRFRIQYAVDALRLLNFPVVSYLKDREGFEQIFNRFYQTGRSMNRISEILLNKACGLELMAHLVEELITEQKLQLNKEIPEVFWTIFRRVGSDSRERITLQRLSQEYHMSPTYISNRFKYYFGMPPIAMRNEFLLERAKLLLKNSELSIGEIAEQTGFENIAAFTHFFTQKSGISPSGFRKTGSMF